MTFLAETGTWTNHSDMSKKAFRRLGSEDPYKLLTGKEVYTSTLKFGLSNSTFIKYGTYLAAGAGTINKSLTIVFSYKIDNVTHYVELLGTRITSLQIHGNPDLPEIECTAELSSKNITVPSTSDNTGSTNHATASSTAPWTYTSGGANPISWGGSAINVLDINARIERSIANKFVMGSAQVSLQYPVKRTSRGDMTIIHTSTNLQTDMRNGVTNDIAWVLATGVSTLTFGGALLESLGGRDFDADADDSLEDKFVFEADSVTNT